MLYDYFGFLISLSFLLFFLSKKFYLYTPQVITSFIWTFVFSFGIILGQGYYYPIKLIVFISWIIWTLGINIAFFLSQKIKSGSYYHTDRSLNSAINYLTLIFIIGLFFKILYIANHGPSNWVLNLRLGSNHVHGFKNNLGIFSYTYFIFYALFLFEWANKNQKNRLSRVLLSIIMLMYAIGTMSKFALITPIIGLSTIFLIKFNMNPRRIFWSLIVAFLLMVTIQLIRKGSWNHFHFVNFISIYVYSPIVALGYYKISGHTQIGWHLFRSFYQMLHDFGLGPVDKGGSPYVYVPWPTNVYTAIEPYLLDFGILGVLGGALIYGFFYGILFKMAKEGNNLALIIYAGTLTTLITQFFAETLITQFSGNVKFILACLCIYLISNKKDVT